MKNFFLNVLSTIIAFVLISIGVYAIDERKKKILNEIKKEKEIQDDLDILSKRSTKKKES